MANVFSHTAPASQINALQYAMPAQMDVWNSSSGKSTPLDFTYTFEAAQPSDLWYGFSGWKAFTDAQKAVVRSALAEFAAMLNITFTEVGAGNADPDINFGRVNLAAGQAGEGGFSYNYTTDSSGNVDSRSLDGFAVFSAQLASLSRNLVLHEVSHALTLKHPGNYDAGGGGSPGPYLPAALDNNKYSVMSYKDNPDNHQSSDHLMLLDIAALQARFGANLSYRTGNDTYTGPKGLIQAIWDAGGTDVIDGAKYAAALTIDLRDGHFSSLGKHHNFAIAYGAIIENGAGAAGKDTIIGNSVGNTLTGRGGADTLKGLGGNDALWGNGGNDLLRGGSGFDMFVFNGGLSATGNVDRVVDFSSAYDTILLDDAVFTALAAGTLAPDAFRTGAASGDAGDRIVYNPNSGALIYDANGNAAGGSVAFATLNAHLSLSNADFVVF